MSIHRPASEIAGRIATLQAAFADQIPTQLHALSQLFEEFATSRWNRQVLERMRIQAREFSGSAVTFGFAALGEAARAFEEAVIRELNESAPFDSRRGGELALVLKRLLGMPAPDSSQLTPLLPPQQQNADAAPGQRQNGPVDIVDGDTELTGLLAEQLRYFGYEVRCFNRLDEFSAAFRHQPAAAVVMSIDFPGERESGPSTMGRLMHESGRSVPVAFISPRDDIQARLAAARAGGNRFLVKPVAVAEVIDAVDALLNVAPPRPYRVMLVDDSNAIGQLYAGVLEGAGMQVAVTTNPLKALDILSEFQPDLAVIDRNYSGSELALRRGQAKRG